MKQALRWLCSPLLNLFESDDDTYIYKKSHRVILLCTSCLFLGLATLVYFLIPANNSDYLFPVVVFGGAGLLGLIISGLGTERAVAKIWGSR